MNHRCEKRFAEL